MSDAPRLHNAGEPEPKSPLPEQKQNSSGLEVETRARYRGSGRLTAETAVITRGDSGIGRAIVSLASDESGYGAVVGVLGGVPLAT